MNPVSHRTLLRHPLASKRYLIGFSQEEDKPVVFDLLCRYEAHGPIGKGTFGYVCAARDGFLIEEYNEKVLGLDDDKKQPDGKDADDDGENDDSLTPEERYDDYTLVAVKKLPHLFENNQYRVWLCATREIQIMMSLKHPNVMACTDFFIPLSETDSMTYEKMNILRQTFDSVYIVMKKFDYTLREVLNSTVIHENEDDESSPVKQCPESKMVLHPFTKEYRQYILYQILKGVGYLHRCRVIHRDLKPENIMLDRNYTTCITDFGQGKKVSSVGSFQTVFDTCTQWYAAPETLTISTSPEVNNMGFIDHDSFHHVDVWSIGCLAAELLIGRPLFASSPGGQQQFRSILEVLGKPTCEDLASIIEYRDEQTQKLFWAGIHSFKQMIGSATGRLESILKSPIESEEDPNEIAMIKGCLELNPKKRITIAEALSSPFFTEAGYDPEIGGGNNLPEAADAFIKEEDISDAAKGREVLWDLFVRQHPEVGELCKKLEQYSQLEQNKPQC